MEQRPDPHTVNPAGDAGDGMSARVMTAEADQGEEDGGHRVTPARPRGHSAARNHSPGERGVQMLALVVVVVAVAVGIAMRAWLLFHEPVTSDEAVAGLIAHQILHGHTYAFFWGQPFGGVEPYVVAGVFAVLGQNSLTLGLTPVLLSAVAAVLVWRVALRLVRSGPVAMLAGALTWVAPFPAVFTSTVEGGYRGVTLICGLVALLLSLRILDGKFRYPEFVGLGLVAGIGWWSLPEIGYFLLPSGLILIGAMVQSASAHRVSQWAVRIGIGVVAFVVGAFPWLWVNAQSGLASLDSSKFPGTVTPLNPGYLGRLRIFFRYSFPLNVNLRKLDTGTWVVGGSGSTAHRVLIAVALAVIVAVVVGAAVLCFLRGGRAVAVVVALLLYPFLVAVQPGTWFWQDGRYTVYLGTLLTLTLAIGSDELASRVARRATRVPRPPRSSATLRSSTTQRSSTTLPPVPSVEVGEGALPAPAEGRVRPWRSGGLIMSAIVIVSMIMTLVVFHQYFSVTPGNFASGWANPDDAAAATAAALEAKGIRYGYGDYWVAYKLDFLGRGQLFFTVAGSDPDRWKALNETVEHAHSPAWLFVPPAEVPEALKQFALTYDVQGPSGTTETTFTAALDRLGIPYKTVDLGVLQAVIPSRPVVQHFDGTITAAPG